MTADSKAIQMAANWGHRTVDSKDSSWAAESGHQMAALKVADLVATMAVLLDFLTVV